MKIDPNPTLTEFYNKFTKQIELPLEVKNDPFQFLMDLDGNLVAIKKNGANNKTEVHTLSVKDNYQKFRLQTGTCLHSTDDTVQFLIAPNKDIIVIMKSNTGSKMTEVHVLSAESNYQKFSLQTATCLHMTDNSYDFLIALNRDIVVIKKSKTGSNMTEVHVLLAKDNYKKYGLQIGTCLHETDNTFEFLMALNRDIIAIKKSGNATTEVHILSAISNYKDYNLQTPTCLHPTDQNFQFVLNPNQEIVAVKKIGNNGKAEIHIIGPSKPIDSMLSSSSSLPPAMAVGAAIGAVGAVVAVAGIAVVSAIANNDKEERNGNAFAGSSSSSGTSNNSFSGSSSPSSNSFNQQNSGAGVTKTTTITTTKTIVTTTMPNKKSK